jgi:DNA-binding transcriptional ArsR family regulator
VDEGQRALLAAYSNPVRLEILDTLRAAAEPLTADEISDRALRGRVGVRSHLATLHRNRLVAKNHDGRWVALPRPVGLPALADVAPDDPDYRLVARAHAVLADRRWMRLREWNQVNVRPQWAAWGPHVIAQDTVMRLTPQEMDELEQAIGDAVTQFRRRVVGDRQDPAGSESVFLVVYAAPLDALRPPRTS